MSCYTNLVSDNLLYKISNLDFSAHPVKGNAVISFFSGDRLIHSAHVEVTKSKIETTTSFLVTGVIGGKEVKTEYKFTSDEEMEGSLKFNPSQIERETTIALGKLSGR